MQRQLNIINTIRSDACFYKQFILNNGKLIIKLAEISLLLESFILINYFIEKST